MSAVLLPPLTVAKHDINAGLQGKWTIEFLLEDGWSLVGPLSVIAVQPDGTDEPLVEADTPLLISSPSVGQISESPNLWGISFDTENGTEQTYWLRAAAQRTNGVDTYGVHRTVRLIARNN